MLVEINLLPQKEQKKLGFIISLVLLVVLFLLVSALYYVQIHATKTSIEFLNTQITNTQQLEAQLQKQQGSVSSNSVNQLKTAIDWADKNRIETIPVMRQLTALLPERGFIQNFTYNDSGTATITVQFDTTTEAAAYLNSLNNSSWIDNASLTSLNTGSDNNSGSNTSSSNSTTASNNGNTSTSLTVGSNTTSTNSKFLPRYTGQFDIQFNQDAIKKAIENSQKIGSDLEGGSGS
jgi:Tfp pilus assembly protein PilN